jgi:hypothetical protein
MCKKVSSNLDKLIKVLALNKFGYFVFCDNIQGFQSRINEVYYFTFN